MKADRFRECATSQLAAGVLAIATDFHHVRLLGLFTVFAAILAALFGPAVAGGMRAFIFRVFCHKTSPLSLLFELNVILKLANATVKDEKIVELFLNEDLRRLAQHDRAIRISQFHHHRFV